MSNKSASPSPKNAGGKYGILSRRPGETERWVLGFTLLFASLFVLLSVVSYYFTWSHDQTIIREGMSWGATGEVANSAGKLGAFTGAALVGKWFGLFALGIPVVLIILSLRIMRVRPLFLDKSVRITFIIMILGSLSLGYLFGTNWGIFGTGLGGEAGIAASDWFVSLIGRIGFALLLVMGWVLVAVYINRRTIKVVNRVGNAVTKGAADLLVRKRKGDGLEDGGAVPWNAKEEEDDYFEVGNVYSRPEPQIEITRPEPEEGLSDTAPGGWDEDTYIPEAGPGTAEECAENGEPYDGIAVVEDEDDDFVVVNHEGERVRASSFRPVKPVTLGAGGVVVGGEDGLEIEKTENREAEAEEEMARLYDPTLELRNYQRPPVEILEDRSTGIRISDEEIRANQEVIREKLGDFGIRINDRIKATIGPTVTLYEIEPAQGVKISRIRNLEEDIALALKVQSIRIVTLGAGRGTVGIEVPNSTREVVSMYSVLKSIKFQDNKFKLPIALGKTIYNEIYIGDLTKMPHLLVAGATGQGKSVGLNAIITSLLYKKHPAELKFVFVDPKQVELSVYAKLEKHFLAKMESEDNAILTDTQKVVYTLQSLVNVMEERYTLLNKAGERNIADYNEKFTNRRLNPAKGHKYLPYIVVVIDEFADMIMTAGKEVEIPITRLAAKARAVGIHLIVATQRPDVKVITGLIKSNIPARIAFKVVSMVDSRTIIDQPGANNLIGMGDMLISINGELTRIQCAFIDTPEIERVTSFISRQKGYTEAFPLPDYYPEDATVTVSKEDMGQLDAMFDEVARFVVQNQQGSTSSIQRRFAIGYNRAGRLMDQLEQAGIVGRAEGSKPREVLIYDIATLERMLLDN